MRIAMFHWDLAVPPRAGAHVHTTKIAAELHKRGHEVHYLCCDLDQRAPLPFPFPVEQVRLADEAQVDRWLPFGRVMRNFMHYWATSPGRIRGMFDAVERARVDVCVASGIHGLLLLHLLKDRPTVWYAGDELALGNLSQLSSAKSVRENKRLLFEAARVALFTRLSRNVPGEIWLVAEPDARSMRRITGRNGDVHVIANGVDLDHYRPSGAPVQPKSAVFWGRLDFGPNEEAIAFLTSQVWPAVLEKEPDAELILMGFSPSDHVRKLAASPGVRLVADAPDIRPVVCSAPIALYPFFSGTGIKNKLLEGAAMGRALLVSPTAIAGLTPSDPLPWRLCRTPGEWRDALLQLWSAPSDAEELGRAARAWVEQHHSWERAGELAEAGIRRVSGRTA